MTTITKQLLGEKISLNADILELLIAFRPKTVLSSAQGKTWRFCPETKVLLTYSSTVLSLGTLGEDTQLPLQYYPFCSIPMKEAIVWADISSQLFVFPFL